MKPIVRNSLGAVLIIGIVAFTATTLWSNKKEVEEKVYRRDPTLKVLVKAAPVEEKDLAGNLQLLGTFQPNQATDIISEANGKVIVAGVQRGDHVKAGALVARLDADLLQAQLIAAEASYAQAQADVARYERIVAGKASPRINLEQAQLQLKSAESQLKVLKEQIQQTIITAPFSGIITQRMFEKGTVVSPGTPLAKIIDISQLKLSINVPENQITSIQPGQSLRVSTDIYPGETFTGKIITIASQADEAHNYEVEVLVPNSDEKPLRAGMYGQVQMQRNLREKTLAIPRTALVGSEKKPQVYVVENGIARLRNITTGAATGDWLEVVDGLKAGQTIVTSGQISLSDSTAVAIAK